MRNLLLILLISFYGCQPDKNTIIKYNNSPAMEWGKQQLISTLRFHSNDNDSTILDKTIVRIKSKESDLPEEARRQEGYQIIVEKGKITITGFDAAGAMYGCLKLAKYINENGRIPENFQLTDAPVLELRGT
jgi:N-acetyl-beta-hexosaminidase